MILHIASGECAANSLRNTLPDAKILPFNEAICEGAACSPIYGDSFCALRATAYGVSLNEYLKKSPRGVLQTADEYDGMELYFDGDMFCAANAVTLLAYLEQEKFGGTIRFNLVEQDGSADVLERFPLRPVGWLAAYESIFLQNKPYKTGVEVFDRALPLLFEYRRKDNEIARFARENAAMDEHALICAMLSRFRAYGLGDTAAKRIIQEQLKQQ